VVTCEESDARAVVPGSVLKELLERTVKKVEINTLSSPPDLEVAIGGASARFSVPMLRVGISQSAITIGSSLPQTLVSPETPGIIILLAAAYATGMALRLALGQRLQVAGPSPTKGLRISIDEVLGADRSWIDQEFELAGACLAGAGAIGNGFLYALKYFPVSGSLVIVDPDVVTDGNLNRCVFFTTDDVDKPKATRLTEIASPKLPKLKLIPEVSTLQEFAKKQKVNDWLKRLIVGVDSRRTRRRLQTEIPGKFSTRRLPTYWSACSIIINSPRMLPVSHASPDELARERHIAESLGVRAEDVKEHHVSADAATRIHTKYPHIAQSKIEGQAYDSLFKALCSEGELVGPGDQQVLAPFAFVSVLAGAYLAIEVARRSTVGRSSHTFNYWRFSPWAAPVEDLKQNRQRNPLCEFCKEKVFLNTAQELWKNRRVNP
jgi:hypothetical protein